MNQSDTLAESYVKAFWPELPEPMQDRLRMAYSAGFHDLRAQASIAAMQGLATRWNFLTAMPDADAADYAGIAVKMADALMRELNNIKQSKL